MLIYLVASILASLASATFVKADNDTKELRQDIPPQLSEEYAWSLRLPEIEKVTFQGVVSFDGTGAGQGTVMYPAPNIGGLVAALITHGVLNESIKNNQKNALVEAANEVLLPYHSVLDSYTHKELMLDGISKTTMTSGRKRLVDHSVKPGSELFIESTPVFSITQDQRAIVLENSITIYAPGQPSTTLFQKSVKAISHALNSEDPVSFWIAEDGKKLKEEAASLFAESLDIALGNIQAASNQNNSPFKTFRYYEGNTEKMERGQLISEYCNRMVIMTLRGWPMSIPVRQESVTAAVPGCATVSRNTKQTK